MKTVDCSNWEEFEIQIKKIHTDWLDRKSRKKEPLPFTEILPEVLYRGQRNYKWRLETTLERERKDRMRIVTYGDLMNRIKPQVETFTNTSWHSPSLAYDEWSPLQAISGFCDYMVYLRHHGFPSPLLDWTRSPYVASFFAFDRASDDDVKVSVYVYLNRELDPSRHSTPGMPMICRLNPNFRSHSRHFLQQSEYTICAAKAEQKADWHYEPHEAAFSGDASGQDMLWKFDIPVSERFKVLKLLDFSNLNEFSLFGSEESLMQTLALRELHLRDLAT
jgi:hypothetical protein